MDKMINVGGKDYILEPSFKNLKRMQLKLGERFMATVHRLSVGDYGPEDVATILWCLIDPSEKIDLDDFSEKVFEDGFVKHYVNIVEIFTGIITEMSGGEGADDGKK
jgi:hypothetical protein